MSEPGPPSLKNIIMREMCWKSNPSCKKCPYLRGCNSRALKAQDTIQSIYFLTPRKGDSLSAIARVNKVEQAELISSETIN